VSKQWNPRKPTVQLAPSRIRREPAPVQKIPEPPSPQQEVLGGMAGVVLFAIALAILIVGVSVATIIHGDPGAAARAARFAQCYDAEGSNCVLDGDTISVEGQRIAIAGATAPRIQGAECDEERSRGIDAAVRLADLLNSGKVTVGATVREPDGQLRRKVEVDGNDVGVAMINAGMAHDYGSSDGWCDQ
jgi:endonuclease YncB( thermonuclease family)